MFQVKGGSARDKKTGRLNRFGVIGVHTRPDDARNEIAGLKRVYSSVRASDKETDVIIMGDLNADCSYFPRSARKVNPLYVSKRFAWVVPDSMDTTANVNTDCAYDRYSQSNVF